jgi:hypothetical protein
MLADDHALVDLRLRADEHLAAILEVPQRIGHGLPFSIEISTPARRPGIGPLCGAQPWNTRFSTPVPRVSVRNSP